MIRVVIAEDHNALIDGIESFLKEEDDIRLVGFVNNGRDLHELVKAKRPDVVVADIRMPVMDGIEATKQILKTDPSIKIIAFTMFDQDEAVRQMLKAGAKGYILKNSKLSVLMEAIRIVHRGEMFYDPAITMPEIQQVSKSKGLLTQRQIEILKLVAQGKTNQEIADQLFIGKTTVETHRKNMIRILNLKGAGELLRYALESKYKF